MGDREVREQMKRRRGTDGQEEIDRERICRMGLGKESKMDDKDTVSDLGIFPALISISFGALPEKVTHYSRIPRVIQSYTCMRKQGM